MVGNAFFCCPCIQSVREEGREFEPVNFGNRYVRVTKQDYEHFVAHSKDVNEIIALDNKQMFDNQENDSKGLFSPLPWRQVASEGTVTGIFCGKRVDDGESRDEDEPGPGVERNDHDIWFLKSVHLSSLATEIKRMAQSLFYRTLSCFCSGDRSNFYLQKSLYFYSKTNLYFREEAGARLMQLVLSKLPQGEREAERWYRSRVYCEHRTRNDQYFVHPELAVKDVSPCEGVNFDRLIGDIERASHPSYPHSVVRPRDYFKASGDPALLYFLRLLLLGDEDCLKAGNYLIKRDGKQRPEFVGIDWGMIFYRGGSKLRSSVSKEQLLQRVMKKSWKHYAQYSCRTTMVELLQRMEALDPGYLSVKFDQALQLIKACTPEELNECVNRVPDVAVGGAVKGEKARIQEQLTWRRGLAAALAGPPPPDSIA